MFKKILFLFLTAVGIIFTTNADTNAGNTYGPGNIGAHGNFVDSVSTLPESAARRMLILQYTKFYYGMNPTEFSQLLAKYSLHQSSDLSTSTNILQVANLTNAQFDTLNKELSKKIYGMDVSIPPAGRYYCDINGGKSCEGMNISFIPQVTKEGVLVKISTTQAYTSPEPFSFVSTATLNNVKNKKYAVITQVKKGDTLFGQIILITFEK